MASQTDNGELGSVLRIIVHGPPEAGKTTTARALGERLGRPVVTPEEDADGRTLLFDWLEYTGGRFDGAPIRTQVVTVPAHDPFRRSELLGCADVVLFVADTTRSGIDGSRAFLDEVRRQLEAGAEPRPGLLIQANKRDAPDALPMDEVRRLLDIDADTTVIESVAPEGAGVRQAFVYAVRAGLHRLAHRSGQDPLDLDGPAKLIAAMRAVEQLHERGQEDSGAPADPDRSFTIPEPSRVAQTERVYLRQRRNLVDRFWERFAR